VFLYGTAAAAKLILVHTLAKKFFYKVSLTLLLMLKGNVVFELIEKMQKVFCVGQKYLKCCCKNCFI